jgi:hypothetical protein
MKAICDLVWFFLFLQFAVVFLAFIHPAKDHHGKSCRFAGNKLLAIFMAVGSVQYEQIHTCDLQYIYSYVV